MATWTVEDGLCAVPFFGTPHCVPYVLYGNLDYPSIRMGSIIGKSRRDLLHFRVAKIKELAPSSWRQANVHRTFAFDCSNPSFSAIKKNPSVRMGSVLGGSRRDLLHFRVAEIKELAPSSWRQANVHRTFAFKCSNPSLSARQTKPPSIGMGVWFIWRSRRDLNPRYPFGVHTISSRARYDHFDTAPCGPVRCRLGYNTTEQGFCQALFFLFSKILCSG